VRDDVGSARGAGGLLGYTLAIPPTWPMPCANRRSARLGVPTLANGGVPDEEYGYLDRLAWNTQMSITLWRHGRRRGPLGPASVIVIGVGGAT
jgi:hypothetical protein